LFETGWSKPSSRILLASKFIERLNFSMRAAVIGRAIPVRSATARVAPNLANKGYSAGKRQYFHGVKLHVLAFSRAGGFRFRIGSGLRRAVPTI
jgi:hypothetical protein